MTNHLVDVSIEHELKTSFLDYAMSVIISRALPDIRDGLKPVHRRILFAMYGLKNFHDKPFLKSARIVGDVLGKYHPHGDSPVYDALVRLAQDFSTRYPLIDGQGNFGSVDGDSAAAMRYTESRLSAICQALLSDIDKDTVDFVPNYDNKEEEPVVLPSRIPQLLINGSSGIAVGMATNIPPHNIREVILGLRAFIEDPNCSLEELMRYIPGPDFPTYGEILGNRGIRDAYKTGRGSFVIRAKVQIEEEGKNNNREKLIVTEIPYQVNKAKLIEKIAELVTDKKIEGISDIRDESSKNEIRIAIDIKRGEDARIVLNNLYKQTQLQISYSINFVALVGSTPKLVTLREVLEEFYKHRQVVVLRRTSFLLKKAREREHILAGLKIAVENMDNIIKLIREADNPEIAAKRLLSDYPLTQIQAKAILEMRLSRLTGLERAQIINEHTNVMLEISNYMDILNSDSRVKQIIMTELDEDLEKYSDERKTRITVEDQEDLSREDLIPNEEVVVIVTLAGYVKRTRTTEIAAQKRGGKGKSGMLTKEEDTLQEIFVTKNHSSILCFTNLGKVFSLKVWQLQEAGLRSRGVHFANYIKFEPQERVVSVLPVEAYENDIYIHFATKKGYVKKTDLMAFANIRNTGIIALKLDPEDMLIGCVLAKKTDTILIATSMGKAIRFDEGDIRPMGRTARGVTGIRFAEQDNIIGIEVLKASDTATLLSVSEKGYGKRTSCEEYRVQARGGKGIFTFKVTEKTGPVVSIAQILETDNDIVIITSAGKLVRLEVKDISVIGRMTQGVKLVSVSEGEKIISLSKMIKEDLDE